MGYRTFNELTHELLRCVNVPIQRATTFDARQAINDSYREIVQFADWNFLLDRYDIPVVAPYTTGTVTATSGSTTVTGSGTTWSTSWYNKKILLSGDTAEKEVATFNSPTQLTLRYPFNSTLSPTTDIGYMIFQDSYPVPSAPGRDLLIQNPVFQWEKLDKYDRYTFDARTAFNRFTAGTRPTIYTEDGVDWNPLSPTYKQVKLQFWPKPVGAQDLILRFFKNVPALSLATDTSVLPQEFDEVLIRLGTYRLRRKFGVPGWAEDHTVAMRTLLQLRDKNMTQTAFDYQPGASMYPPADSWAVDASLATWPGRIG